MIYRDKDNKEVTMSVREMPNGQVEVELSIAGGAKEKALIKMIDRHESYSNLDSWFA